MDRQLNVLSELLVKVFWPTAAEASPTQRAPAVVNKIEPVGGILKNITGNIIRYLLLPLPTLHTRNHLYVLVVKQCSISGSIYQNIQKYLIKLS